MGNKISSFNERRVQPPSIDSFDDLFGGVSDNVPMLTNSNKTVSIKSNPQSDKSNSGRPLIK